MIIHELDLRVHSRYRLSCIIKLDPSLEENDYSGSFCLNSGEESKDVSPNQKEESCDRLQQEAEGSTEKVRNAEEAATVVVMTSVALEDADSAEATSAASKESVGAINFFTALRIPVSGFRQMFLANGC